MAGLHMRLLSVAFILAILGCQCRAQDVDEEGDERTFGLFSPKGHKYSPPSGFGGGGFLSSLGGIVGQLFGGNPYYGSGYGYGGGFGGSPFIGGHPVNPGGSPFIGGHPVYPGGYGPGFPPGYYGGYRHYPGGYGGGLRDEALTRDLDQNI